ncbi:MAG: energy-coupling factor transporter ATPase [Oscillospiraceae bacterium]|jgi:energy-coupling factor transport system ATP-binding protein|nr:energy-coupling factor transporter ATPase [Oscillospiraceae bacterium]
MTIETTNLQYTYDTGEDALQSVTLSFSPGSFNAVLGHNGSGKSTFAKLLNALLEPSGGSVLIDGLSASDPESILPIRQRVGMVFQNPDNQLVASIVEDDVAFGPENLGIAPEEIRRRVDEALANVHMTAYAEHAPHLLSGGQKQRIAIAGILACLPKCIILDEPTAMLDPKGRAEVLSTIHEMNRKYGITVILITHHMREAVDSDRVIVFSDGTVVADGTPREVFSAKLGVLANAGIDPPETVKLLQALRAKGLHVAGDALTSDECAAAIAVMTKANSKSQIANRKDGGTETKADNSSHSERELILQCRKLRYTYSAGTPFEFEALAGVDFDLPKGVFAGIIGQTGSGKSTFIQHLNGLLKPNAGTILLNGEDLHRDKAAALAAKYKIGLVFQYPEYQLFEETVYKDISFGPKNMNLTDGDIDVRVREAAKFAGLTDDLLDKSPFALSGGQKRRVAIAGVIAMRPEVLILDEPSAGLDPIGRRDLLANLLDYHKSTGSTVLLVSHSMDEIAETAELIYVFNDGKIELSGTPSEVFVNAERLRAIGLDIPEVTQIALKLRKLGIDVPANIYTIDDAVREILRLC